MVCLSYVIFVYHFNLNEMILIQYGFCGEVIVERLCRQKYRTNIRESSISSLEIYFQVVSLNPRLRNA